MHVLRRPRLTTRPQLTVPTTGVLAWYYMNTRFNLYNYLGSLLVLGGCLLVAVPPMIQDTPSHTPSNTTTTTLPPTTSYFHDTGDQQFSDTPSSPSNAPVWVIVFALSVFPNSICWVIQERLFEKDHSLDPALLLFWSNFYTLIFYVLSAPLTLLKYLGDRGSLSSVMHSEHDAFVCIGGPSERPPGCEEVML